MATVAIWKIESNLKQVLNYTTDKEKTNENIKDLDNVLSYIKDELKKSIFGFFIFSILFSKYWKTPPNEYFHVIWGNPNPLN